MLQNIEPKQLCNRYQEKKPQATDPCFVFHEQSVLIRDEEGLVELPCYTQLQRYSLSSAYLFAIDADAYFLLQLQPQAYAMALSGYRFVPLRSLRLWQPKEVVFAVMTAWHLYAWYRDNRFCGRCGQRLVHSIIERRLNCPICGNIIYPRIYPAVIIGVTNGKKLLMSKYSGRAYKGYALLAGFSEIGETAEQTVEREVMEEVGLKVKNIRYYKSQPWGIDSNLLLGYFAEVDGSDEIVMDTNELELAQWYNKGEVEISRGDVSLTNEMINFFFDQQ